MRLLAACTLGLWGGVGWGGVQAGCSRTKEGVP